MCRHEPLLSGTTDADEKFPDRITAYTIDGDLFEGVFTTDLTLAEIKTLRAVQTRQGRDPNYDGEFEVCRYACACPVPCCALYISCWTFCEKEEV